MASFALHFLGRPADDPLVERLRSAARAADLADALAHARDPATIAAVQNSLGPRDPLKDAIRPVYPLETLLGIAASGAVGGAPAALRAAGGAFNYDPARNRSILSANAQALLDRFGGRGRQVGKIPVGQPGSKEAFDTKGEIIGIYKNKEGTISEPTTRGVIHYGTNTAHVVPSEPGGW